MNWLGGLVQTHVSMGDSVLDLGCGIMQATDELKCKSMLGCDIWPVYLNKIKDLCPVVTISMDELDRFVDQSYDVVICLDVIEHLKYDEKYLTEMQRIARKKLIIFTPKQFKTNEEHIENAWDLGRCEYQLHISQWPAPRLKELGFTITKTNDNGLFGVWTR